MLPNIDPGNGQAEDAIATIPIFEHVKALPRRVGRLWLRRHHDYGTAELGWRIGYGPITEFPAKDKREKSGDRDFYDFIARHTFDSAPGFEKIFATNYLYEGKRGLVTKETITQRVDRAFASALHEIEDASRDGTYSKFELLKHGGLSLTPDPEETTWLWAALRFRILVLEPDQQFDAISHVAVRVDAGYLNKIRFTYPVTLKPEVGYRNFLRYLYEWKTSIDRIHSGKDAIGPFEIAQEQEWGRFVHGLERAPVPDELIIHGNE